MASEVLLMEYAIVWCSSTTKGSCRSKGSIEVYALTSLVEPGESQMPCVARVKWAEEDDQLDIEFGAVYDTKTRRLDQFAFRGETNAVEEGSQAKIEPSIETGPEDKTGIPTLKVTAFLDDLSAIDGFPECIELWAMRGASQDSVIFESELRRMGVMDESHERLNEMLQDAIAARFDED